MLGENIKRLRRNKGLTQEELAARLNVVRQTVSKWEKETSVPDAVMLQKIAEVLDTDVTQLLGAEVMEPRDLGEIAEQLARINEQLAVKNRRWKKVWKIIGIVLGLFLLINALIVLFSTVMFMNVQTTGESDTNVSIVEMEETALNGIQGAKNG